MVEIIMHLLSYTL